MSSRQLRKLQQQRELEQAQAKLQASTEASDDSEEDSTAFQPPKAKPSLFASFAALDNGDDDEDSDAENKDTEAQDNLSEPEPAQAASAKKAKKSKKKKKAKKVKEPERNDDLEHQDGPDEIDAALAALKIQNQGEDHFDSNVVSATNPQYEKICCLLGINTQHLKLGNEMRNLFGKGAAEGHDEAGGAAARGSRRRQRGPQQVDLETALKGQHAPGKGLPEVTIRRNIFIQGKEDWPRASTGGLTMAVVPNSAEAARRGNGVVEFRFMHDQNYQKIQQQFDFCVEMGEPKNLIGLLQRNPYHISCLIQVSKIAKDQSDHSLSADLLERALFTFARSSTSLFATKLKEGKAFLDFRRPENRELWLAGYQYIKVLILKGTYRTAFEWAKLLYSLDFTKDPYQMSLTLHSLALKANENQWLLDCADTLSTSPSASHTFPSYAYAAMQNKDPVKSRSLLEESMQTLPWLFVQLFREINLDAPSSIWGATPRTDAETLFTEIYVRQTKDLWNTPEATSLLMEIAHSINKVDVSNIPLMQNDAITLDVVRFVYLDNTPALMGMVPSALLHRSNNSDSDPLPPDVNIYSYESQRMHLEPRGAPGGPGGLQGDFFDPIAALARLIPGFGGTADAEGDEEERVQQDELRRQLEHAVAAEEEQEATRDPDQAPQEPRAGVSIARRLLDMFWGQGDQVADSDSLSDHTNTDSEEENPGH
ncbi:hypothetical protein BP5796_02756 [Coleophoma crateriformis]|uniref:DUF654-domain-containing protein n=1 Tax=Coleophoma crateriformis TaxID=565419 RepID=A0A3D8SZJ5_9HELO|nr:hypothetical protein BP5796_02756 [Coleophoma crateriformis]